MSLKQWRANNGAQQQVSKQFLIVSRYVSSSFPETHSPKIHSRLFKMRFRFDFEEK